MPSRSMKGSVSRRRGVKVPLLVRPESCSLRTCKGLTRGFRFAVRDTRNVQESDSCLVGHVRRHPGPVRRAARGRAGAAGRASRRADNPAMGEFDLGGVYVNYSPKARRGWGTVDLTVIGPSGKLLR